MQPETSEKARCWGEISSCLFALVIEGHPGRMERPRQLFSSSTTLFIVQTLAIQRFLNISDHFKFEILNFGDFISFLCKFAYMQIQNEHLMFVHPISLRYLSVSLRACFFRPPDPFEPKFIRIVPYGILHFQFRPKIPLRRLQACGNN